MVGNNASFLVLHGMETVNPLKSHKPDFKCKMIWESNLNPLNVLLVKESERKIRHDLVHTWHPRTCKTIPLPPSTYDISTSPYQPPLHLTVSSSLLTLSSSSPPHPLILLSFSSSPPPPRHLLLSSPTSLLTLSCSPSPSFLLEARPRFHPWRRLGLGLGSWFSLSQIWSRFPPNVKNI